MGIPLVSICCLAYNHENYIRPCLEGFLMQKTNFTFEVLIHDDASTDKTAEIIKEYEEKHPVIIKPLFQKENQFSKGIAVTPLFQFPRAKGKYIAMCEGDDFWIEPNKLQKQIDFLEKNPEFSLCFHDALVYWEDKSRRPYYFCRKLSNTTYDVEDIINKWIMPSASMVFRKESILPLPDWFKDVYNRDYALQLLLALKGKIYYFDEIMCIYRRNSISLSANVKTSKINRNVMKLLEIYNNHTECKYDQLIKRRRNKLHFNILFGKIKNIIRPFLSKYL